MAHASADLDRDLFFGRRSVHRRLFEEPLHGLADEPLLAAARELLLDFPALFAELFRHLVAEFLELAAKDLADLFLLVG